MHTWCSTATATAVADDDFCSVIGLPGSHVVNIYMMDDANTIDSHRYGNVNTLISLSLYSIPYHARSTHSITCIRMRSYGLRLAKNSKR